MSLSVALDCLGWDVDRFPADVYKATFAMYEVLKNGPISGGLNFDSKTRRASNTYEEESRREKDAGREESFKHDRYSAKLFENSEKP